jgi:peptidase E
MATATAAPGISERPVETSESPPVRRILALGGHDFTSRPPDRAVSELMLRLATERAGGRPRICILPTASGDTSEQIGRFYAAFGERPCEPSDLSLFRLGRRPMAMALRDHLLAQDLVYVGGGSLVNLLAVWEAHEIGAILSLAWRQGIVLAGQSAGAMCWFEAGITKSSGKPLAAAGLGLLGGSLCVHYNNEPERRAAYLEAVGNGMPGGYGLDDYAGLLWEGEGAPSAVTARRGARAYRVVAKDGGVTESPLPSRFLPAPAPAALREDIAEYRRLTSMRKRAGWLG